MSSWNAFTGSTSAPAQFFCSPFTSGEEFGVILVTEISDDVIDDEDVLSDEFTGDLGLCVSIPDALATSWDKSELEYEEGEGGLFIFVEAEEDEMGANLSSEEILSPFLLLKMLS